jgi:hypothetical protein
VFFVTLPFSSHPERANAAVFIAQLVREGVVFKAVVEDDLIVVKFTGGY